MKPGDLKKLLVDTLPMVFEAGECIMEVYSRDDLEIELKEDQSPLTLADRASHTILTSRLQKSGYPVLSEEGTGTSWELRKKWDHFWLVDPLDGTKEFINGNGEFTVNIALIEKGQPVLGIMYLPVFGSLYYAARSVGSFFFRKKEGSSFPEDFHDWISESEKLPGDHRTDEIRVSGSRSHQSEATVKYIEKLKSRHENIVFTPAGSSLKFGLIAEGRAEVYPRFGPTMEWDIAAGEIIVRESGGTVLQADGSPMEYNKKELRNPWFIAKSRSFIELEQQR